MELFRAIMLNVIVLTFFTTILDLLLPDGTFRNYIKMAMGFFTVLIVLQPLVQWVEHEDLTSLRKYVAKAEQAVMAESTVLQEQENSTVISGVQSYQEQAEAQYAKQLEKQIEALLLLSNHTVQSVQCYFLDDIKNDTTNDRIRQLQVTVQLVGDLAEVEQIQTAISGYFGLSSAQVKIIALLEEDIRDDK